jgi:hypothetical protein
MPQHTLAHKDTEFCNRKEQAGWRCTLGNFKDPPKQFVELEAGVALAKVNAG